MYKNLDKLHNTTFDVVIVGGGIHGGALAAAAATAGWRVALLEKGDFAHSTSANSLKIVHGGIRYLQHGDIKRMRESIVSRRDMMQLAPHLVKPLRCLMPTSGHGIKGRETMRLAFALYDLIAWDRNRGLHPTNRLPGTAGLSREEVKLMVPGLADTKLSGGAVWYDAIALDSERLVLEYIKEAVRYGAEVANYLEVTEVKMQGERVAAVVARDLASGRELTISCRTVVNAAGPWLERLAGASSQGGQQRWAMAMNLVVRKKLFDGVAVGLEGYTEFTDKDALIKRGKRLFFFVPWEERYTMIGTTYVACSEDPDRFSLKRQSVAAMVDDINKIYPPACLSMDEVTSSHAGLLPMKGEAGSGDSVQLDKSSTIVDHGSVDGRQGLFSIKGVKYTTAPDIAAKMVKLLAKERWLGACTASRYQQRSPQYLDFGPTISRLGGDYEKVRNHLGNRYGSDWRQVFAIVVREGGEPSSLWLLDEPPLLRAELLYFIEQEMAVTLADVVFRRTNIGAAECPSQEVLVILTEAMATRLGWDESERERQQVAVREVFSPLAS